MEVLSRGGRVIQALLVRIPMRSTYSCDVLHVLKRALGILGGTFKST